ncbi:hypothetical protein NC651_000017 [Populus alba x Populus x berolinensis]|nr:hypothetical protein NC651_000017 [Populus alba x Populus x berolinensis]
MKFPIKKPPQASPSPSSSSSSAIQIYNQIERFKPLNTFMGLLTETARQSHDSWGGSKDWSEVELLFLTGRCLSNLTIRRCTLPSITLQGYFGDCHNHMLVVIRLFLHRGSKCSSNSIGVFGLCQETVQDIPTFGIGHSLGSVIHLLIWDCGLVWRNGIDCAGCVLLGLLVIRTISTDVGGVQIKSGSRQGESHNGQLACGCDIFRACYLLVHVALWMLSCCMLISLAKSRVAVNTVAEASTGGVRSVGWFKGFWKVYDSEGSATAHGLSGYEVLVVAVDDRAEWGIGSGASW